MDATINIRDMRKQLQYGMAEGLVASAGFNPGYYKESLIEVINNQPHIRS